MPVWLPCCKQIYGVKPACKTCAGQKQQQRRKEPYYVVGLTLLCMLMLCICFHASWIQSLLMIMQHTCILTFLLHGIAYQQGQAWVYIDSHQRRYHRAKDSQALHRCCGNCGAAKDVRSNSCILVSRLLMHCHVNHHRILCRCADTVHYACNTTTARMPITFNYPIHAQVV